MASHKTEDQSKTPKTTKIPGKEELRPEDLNKVVGGLKKNTGSGRIGDPCDGGE